MFSVDGARLVVGMPPTGGESPMRKQVEEDLGKRFDEKKMPGLTSEMKRRTKKKVVSSMQLAEENFEKVIDEKMKMPGLASEILWLRRKEAQMLMFLHKDSEVTAELIRKFEERDAILRETAIRKLLARQHPHGSFGIIMGSSSKKKNCKNKTTKDEKAVTVGSSKSAMEDEVMGKEEPLQQLLKGMPNKFDILDPDGDDDKEEIGRGKSAIVEEHMPSDWKNTSDRGEESVVVGVGSSKSAIDQPVVSLEREESVTEAVKEDVEGALLPGLDSLADESPMRKQAEEDLGKIVDEEMPGLTSEIKRLMEKDVEMMNIKDSGMAPKLLQKRLKGREEVIRKVAMLNLLLAMDYGSPIVEAMGGEKYLEHLAKKVKKNQKQVQDEAAGKAVASVADAGRTEAPVTEAWKAEEAVMVGSGKSAMDQAVNSLETEESVTEAVKEAEEGAILPGRDSMADESLLQKKAEAESGKRFETIVDGKYYPAITHQEAEKLTNESHKRREAERTALQPKQVAKGKETKANAKVKVEEAGKAVTEAGRSEESAIEAVKKEAEEGGALLVGMRSTDGVSSMQKQAEEGALLCSTGSEPLMRKEAEEESGKRPERQLYAEIQRALLDIQEKLAKKSWKNWKTDKQTLQLLKDMSNKLDMLDQCGDDKEMDEIEDMGELDIDLTCLDPNEDTNTTMVESDQSLLEPLAKEMADEAESFAEYSRNWDYKWRKTCGFFRDPTIMSSMQFTHYTPGRLPYSIECSTLQTLQIISIKLTELADGLELPLSVYGVVAVRDMVDRNRNIIFSRDMSKPQQLKQNDPFLHLTGPSRAIVFMDKVCIEVKLRVKSGAHSQDKALISCVRRYMGENGPGISTICFKNSLCTVEMCLQPVEQTVQATILGVQVASEDGSWPLQYGGLVACSPLSGKRVLSDSGYTRVINTSSSQIVLIESEGEAVPKGLSGHVLLRRQVVSVQLDGRLDIFIKAYSKSGAIAAETRVHFYPKISNVSQKKCYLGDTGVTVTVAWSLVAANKTELCFELRGGSNF